MEKKYILLIGGLALAGAGYIYYTNNKKSATTAKIVETVKNDTVVEQTVKPATPLPMPVLKYTPQKPVPIQKPVLVESPKPSPIKTMKPNLTMKFNTSLEGTGNLFLS